MPSLVMFAFACVLGVAVSYGMWHGLQAQGNMAVLVSDAEAQAKVGEEAAENTAPLEEDIEQSQKKAEAEHAEASEKGEAKALYTPVAAPVEAAEEGKKEGKKAKAAQLEAVKIVDKPKSDARNYSAMVLPNGMEAVAVQDTRSNFAAYSVAVMVGSYDDPLDFQGLSHFCEHMLFLGTEKYPGPTDFDDFLNTHGGSFNAYTSSEVTDYFLQVSADQAGETSARFADFFQAPLFTDTFVDKEVNAVNSEHEKNRENSDRRIYQTMQSLAADGSVQRKFATGDITTLRHDEPVVALREHFEKHYCPARMRVVSFGPANLEEQLGILVSSFGQIDTRSDTCSPNSPTHNETEPWPETSLGKWVDIVGVSQKAQLLVEFHLPSVYREYKTSPLDYLAWSLVFKGPNSPFEVLRDRLGLVENLDVGADSDTTGSTVSVEMELTEDGQKNPELVLDVLFGYLASARREGIDDKVYRSITDTDTLRWKWQEPADPMTVVKALSERLTRVRTGDILWADQVARTMAPKRAKELLRKLTVSKANIAFVDPAPLETGQSRGTVPAGGVVRKLDYYDVEYAVRDIGDVFPEAPGRWNGWAEGTQDGSKGLNTAELHGQLKARLKEAGFEDEKGVLPSPPKAISGLPEEVRLDHADGTAKPDNENQEVSVGEAVFGARPQRLEVPARAKKGEQKKDNVSKDADAGARDEVATGIPPEVWYREGWTSNAPVFSPEAAVHVMLRVPNTGASGEISARDQVRMSLYTTLFNEEIDTQLAELDVLGAKVEVVPKTKSLVFSVSSLAPLLGKAVGEVVSKFSKYSGLPNAQGRFKRIHHAMQTALTSYEEMPISYAIADRNLLLTKGVHSQADLAQELEHIDVAAASSALQDLLLSKPLQATALAMGNMDKKTAQVSVSAIIAGVASSEAQKASVGAHAQEVEKLTPIVALNGPVELRKKNPRNNDPNDAVVVSLVSGIATVEKRVHLGLLGELLGNVAFTELRTKMELGYVASGGMIEIENVLLLSCIVQGTKEDADVMEAAVQHAYTKTMPEMLSAMPEEQVDELKSAYLAKLMQAPFLTGEEVNRFWSITSTTGAPCFELIDEVVAYVRTSVTKSSLVRFWNELVLPEEGVRSKLTVKYFADEPPARPSVDEMAKLWEEQGVAADAMDLLRREYDDTLVVSAADAGARAEVLEKRAGGKYFPPTINCKRQVAAAVPHLSSMAQAKLHGHTVENAKDQSPYDEH